MASDALPYCGPPPAPEAWAQHWNLDPTLLACWLAGVLVYELAARRPSVSRSERRAFRTGATIALSAWVSPLCALGVALFSARVAQHMALALLAAPLLARGWPASANGGVRAALAATGAFAAATWHWHAPAPYDATFRSDALYWAMHLSLLGAAVALWRALLRRDSGAPLIGLACAALTSVQMGLLGALLTFAPAPLFESHLLTSWAWGLSPLEDQQLGGLVLWIPGCGAFLLLAAWSFAAGLRAQAGTAGGTLGSV
jgi:putative membrane protein